jgi:imidazolonepropionase-like amidohydrolase
MGSNSKELQLYVTLGMSPMEAITSATRDAAESLGLGRTTGTIVPGKALDLIAVDGDPTADITLLQDKARIKLVMKAGEIYIDKLSGERRYVIHPEPAQWKIIDAL